jgi:hypothetical protein
MSTVSLNHSRVNESGTRLLHNIRERRERCNYYKKELFRTFSAKPCGRKHFLAQGAKKIHGNAAALCAFAREISRNQDAQFGVIKCEYDYA